MHLRHEEVPAVYELSYEPFSFRLDSFTRHVGSMKIEVPPGDRQDPTKSYPVLEDLINTLGSRLRRLTWQDHTTDRTDSQLMAVSYLDYDPGRYPGNCLLGVLVSPKVRAWLKQHGEPVYAAAEQAMRGLMSHLWPSLEKDYVAFECRAWPQDNGYFMLQCNGNACDLGVDGIYREDDDRGYELTPHNLDNPMQQLTLLAGATVVWQEAREALKGVG